MGVKKVSENNAENCNELVKTKIIFCNLISHSFNDEVLEHQQVIAVFAVYLKHLIFNA